MDRGRDQFLRDSPFENPHDPADASIDLRPAVASLHHRSANCLQGHRSELPGQSVAVELAEWSNGKPHVPWFHGWLAILDVVDVSMAEVGFAQLIDGDVGADSGSREPTTIREPLGQKSVILDPTLR